MREEIVVQVRQGALVGLGVILAIVFFVLIYVRLGNILKTLQNIMRRGTEPPTVTKRNEPAAWGCPKCGTQNPNTTFKCDKFGFSLI